MKMTRIQFDTIRRLALAFGHEWADALNFERRFEAPFESHGQTVRTVGEHAALMARNGNEYLREVTALHARIEAGYVPTTEQIGALFAPQFEDSTFPNTPHVALEHCTCTRRTRWRVGANGSVQFEFVAYSTSWVEDPRSGVLLARAEVYTSRGGIRSVCMDALVPRDTWGFDHEKRIRYALGAAGCSAAEIDRAFRVLDFGLPHACKFDLADLDPWARAA